MHIPPLMDLKAIPQIWRWYTQSRVTLVPYSRSMEINNCKQFIGFIAHDNDKLYFINQASIDPSSQKDFVMNLSSLANFNSVDSSIYLHFYEVLCPLELLFESTEDKNMTMELLTNYKMRDDT